MSTIPANAQNDFSLAPVSLPDERSGLTDGVQPRQEFERSSETAAPHPEEMKLALELSVGKSVSFKGTARTTPAGLAAAALLVCSVLIPLIYLAKARARGRVD